MRPSAIGRCLVAAVLPVAIGCGLSSREPARLGIGDPQRIVSLAPSVTDTLFELGVGDRVVAVTRYCRPPVSAGRLPEVGGYLDVNLEAIVALEPDLVVVIQDHDETRRRLESLGVQTLRVDQGTIDGIVSSITDIAAVCGVPEAGARLADRITRRLDRTRRMTAGRPTPSTLVVVGRDVGTGSVDSMWIAGTSTFYDGVVELAGGINAAPSSSVAYPEISREGLLHLDPDVVLDVLADVETRPADVEVAMADWRRCIGLRALDAGRIYPIEEPWAVVPGPRIADLAELVARRLHPEVFQ